MAYTGPMTNTTPDPALVSALYTYEARQVKAAKMAPVAITLAQTMDAEASVVDSLLALSRVGWLLLATTAGAAGRNGQDTPSLVTRAMVVAEVKRLLGDL